MIRYYFTGRMGKVPFIISEKDLDQPMDVKARDLFRKMQDKAIADGTHRSIVNSWRLFRETVEIREITP